MSTRKKYMEDNDLKMNMSSIFIMPMLNFDNTFLTDEFLSAYISESERDNPKIVLVFENADNEKFKDSIWVLEQHDSFTSINYDDNEKEVVMMFYIPKDFIADFHYIMAGRYSKITKNYKEVLLDYHGRKAGGGKCIYMIDALYPDVQTKKYRADKLDVSVNDLPNGEVMSIPDSDNETYLRTENLSKKVELAN